MCGLASCYQAAKMSTGMTGRSNSGKQSGPGAGGGVDVLLAKTLAGYRVQQDAVKGVLPVYVGSSRTAVAAPPAK